MYRENSNTSQEVKLQLKFPAKNTLALDTNEQTFNRDNADGHSQRGNRKKNWLVEFKDKPNNKSNEKHLEMANSRGWELLSCQIPQGGDEKRVQMPRPPLTLQHFSLITQSNNAVLSILMCDFSFKLTSSFVIELGF